jgi:hypothetical protein
VKWLTRCALALFAFAGTAAYAASFRFAGAGPGGGVATGAGDLAAAVGVAAALSWPVFGVALLRLTRARPSACAWADACLRTMTCGVAVLCAAAVANVAVAATGTSVPVRAFLGTHAALLLAGNALMGVVFVRQAARLEMKAGAAAAVWALALDAPFAAVLALFVASFNMTGVV